MLKLTDNERVEVALTVLRLERWVCSTCDKEVGDSALRDKAVALVTAALGESEAVNG